MLLGDVAQLAERFVRNEEVVGSTPIVSTPVVVSPMESPALRGTFSLLDRVRLLLRLAG